MHKAVEKLEKLMGDVPLDKLPEVSRDHPEEDISAPLSLLGVHYYQLIIGCLNWVTTLGRMDIACATSSLAHFSS